ncbi:MAG: DPP IV N-terminal domain-containing protein [Bacteroidales bacterium]|nr:DPP IV N-terminal domain-containing protein [Bacteroidales bacterium]
MRIKHFVALVMMAMCTALSAQKNFTLNDLLGGGNNAHNLRPESIYTVWWGNTALQTTPDGVKNLLTGETVVSVEQVNKWVPEHIAVSGHYFAFPYADEPIVQVMKGNRRVLVNFKTGEVVMDCTLPRDAGNSDFNSVSKFTAFTIQGNLYVSDAKGNQQQISKDGSTDGSDNIVYGTSVHRDEFGITKGTFWSPDGQQLAFYRMDQSMVPSYPQVDIFPRISQTYTDHYPMAGETSHQVKVGIYNVNTKKTVWLDLEGAPDDYHTNISWAPDGKTIYVFELNRDQNDMRLVAYSAETGKSLHTVLQECDPKYVEPMNGLEFLPWDASKAVMQSQRDGYNHLYLLDLKTDKLTQITKGNWVVQEFVGFNTKDKTLIYKGNESDPRRSCLYSISIKGGKSTLIGAEDGVHYASLSADGQQVLDQYTSPTVPRSINLLSTKTGKGKNLLTAADRWVEQGYNIPEITSGSIKAADGVTDLYYRMVKPVDFDPSKKYPTVIYVYGGPHAHNVEASWHWGLRGWEAYMATKGYLLFILDNRGSEWRGKDFEQATFRQLGEIEMQDQMEGVKYLKSLPYVDADRMGVHGWSFGGFMTTNLMCSYPDVFKVGVAGGPVIDWKYYEVMYGERYMDTPQTNPEGYAKCSLVSKAKNLKGRLQIIYGYNDPTCVPQHTLSFINACIDANTQPDLFTYPGEGHNMRGIKQVHLHERITRYFEDHLK